MNMQLPTWKGYMEKLSKRFDAKLNSIDDLFAALRMSHDFFAANNLSVHLETRLDEVLDDGVMITDKDGKQMKIEADSVIFSVGYKPAPVSRKRAHVHVIGDADKVGSLRTVIWQAWDVAMKL